MAERNVSLLEDSVTGLKTSNGIKVPSVTGGVSTDNAIVRFDGTSGQVQNSGVIIDDAGNVGIGVTPSAWESGWKAIDFANGLGLASRYASAYITANSYYGSQTGTTYKENAPAGQYGIEVGQHIWRTAPSGTAGQPITWTNAMTLDASGVLNVQNLNGTQNFSKRIIIGDTTGAKPSHQNFIEAGSTSWGDNGYMAFGTQNTEKMRLSTSGNLLVGTTIDTGSKLSVVSNTDIWHMRIGSASGDKNVRIGGFTGNGGVIQAFSAGDIVGTLILQRDGGNLLVGTTTDNGVDKLQVNGSISAKGINTGKIVIFSALNTWHTIPNVSVTSGLFVIRNSTHGGGVIFHADPNAGVIQISNNLLGGVDYVLQFNPDGSGLWKIKQTVGDLTSIGISTFTAG